VSETPWSNRGRAIAALLVPILASFILFMVLIRLVGRDPIDTLSAIAFSGFGSRTGLTETVVRMTPLLLCALAAALPAKAGLMNIGGEGQLYLGATGATAIVLYATWLPHLLVVPSMILAAVIGGAFWGLIPGILRGRFRVNEVLVSLMLNYVAIFFVEYLVHGPWRDPGALGWPYSARFPGWAILPSLGATNIHLGLLFGLLLAGGAYLLERASTWGFAIRVINSNPKAAQYAGIPVAHYYIVLFALGGAVAALAGLGEVSVIQGRLRPGFSPGYGFSGFLVAWLARHHFLLIVPMAFLVGGLYTGADALQLTAGLPSATVDIFMGLVYISVLMGIYLRRNTVPRKAAV
jgi:general nucleoside transport system permease protein